VKLAGKHRFEIYCFDFAFGSLLVSVLAAFTLGTMGADITFMDNLTIVRKLQLGYAGAGGILFNLGIMLLLAALSLAGMAVAFTISSGTALVVLVIANFVTRPRGNPAAGRKKPPPKRTATKGVAIGIASGILIGAAFPFLDLARRGGEIEAGPYPIAFVLAFAVLGSTLLFNLYFLNLPVQGQPISILEYFRCPLRQHLLGWVGGILWGAGVLCCLSAAGAPPEIGLIPEAVHVLGLAAGVLAAVWAILVWKELNISARVRIMMWSSIVALAAGLALVCSAFWSVAK
jgi:glucose uptake protein